MKNKMDLYMSHWTISPFLGNIYLTKKLDQQKLAVEKFLLPNSVDHSEQVLVGIQNFCFEQVFLFGFKWLTLTRTLCCIVVKVQMLIVFTAFWCCKEKILVANAACLTSKLALHVFP